MKRIFSYILIFVLFFDVISFSYFDSVYAASIEDPSTFDELGYILKHPGDLVRLVLGSAGIIFGGTGDFFAAHDEYTEKLQGWIDEGKIKVSSGSLVGGSGITVDASVTQEILDDVKQYVSDNGGYTLVPTLKPTDFVSTEFYNIKSYRTFLNVVNSSDEPIGVYLRNSDLGFALLPDFPYIFIRHSAGYYYYYYAHNESSHSNLSFTYYVYDSSGSVLDSYDDIASVDYSHGSAQRIYLADVLSDVFEGNGGHVDNYFSTQLYLVTRSGFSVPVFDDLNAYTDYALGHGLYFTGSNYDGIGKEITITAEDIQNIQDGLYDGMYEQLQKLIEENNVDPLDSEKLSELTDQVLNSLGDIEQNTSESNSILQKILDVLNDMNGFLHTNITGSSDIDLSALYSRLDSVVDELRSMSSALGDISSSSGGSADVDVSRIESRLDDISSQLAKEADTLESLNNAVDGTNSTLAELNSNISDLSSSLDEMYKSLDGLKVDADNTDVVNKLNDVQEQIKLTNGRLDDVYDVIHKYLPLMSDILQELKDIHKTQVGFGLADTAVDILQGLLDDLGSVLSGIIELPEVNIRLALDDFNKAYEDTGAVEMLKKKFPFSIPWDIAFLVGFLADEPQAPKFELPLVFEKYGINEKLVIDFEDFGAISKVSRTLLTIIYLVALMKFTTNIITKE